MLRKIAIGVGGTIAYGCGIGAAYLVWQTDPNAVVTDNDRDSVWSNIASTYDSSISKHEDGNGIQDERRRMMAHARGRVLEVAAGTARNLPFVNNSISDLVLTDMCSAMCEQASQSVKSTNNSKVTFMLEDNKEKKENSGVHGVDIPVVRVSVVQCKGEELPFADADFDTVIDTFGLCSVHNPATALAEMTRLCKPGGKILLLEHGHSEWAAPVNKYLDWRAANHARDWGCFWNRDLPDLVGTLASAGVVEVELHHTFHLGTGHLYVLQRTDTPAVVGGSGQ